MNAKADDDNFAPELDGMIPVYVYTGDVIEDMGNNWGRLHLMFLDDNSYGSTIAGHGENLGGTMMYTALDINFGPDNNDPNLIAPSAALEQNYPNPFNPTTTIKYQIKNTGHVQIEVFNVKGQKVATLVNREQSAGDYQVVWNGQNDAKKSVPSGVYFYKMKSGDYSVSKKMILLK